MTRQNKKISEEVVIVQKGDIDQFPPSLVSNTNRCSFVFKVSAVSVGCGVVCSIVCGSSLEQPTNIKHNNATNSFSVLFSFLKLFSYHRKSLEHIRSWSKVRYDPLDFEQYLSQLSSLNR